MASLPKRQTETKLAAEELAVPITRHNFWARVAHYVKYTMGSPDELPTIRPGTADWDAWQEYFERHLQWLPTIMREVLDERSEAMTVPTPRPEQFDLSFVEQPGYRPQRPWFRLERQRLEALRAAQQVDHTERAKRSARSKPYRLNNVFVAPGHSVYPRMVERYDRGEGGQVGEFRGVAGLWVPLAWLPQQRDSGLNPLRVEAPASLSASPVLAARIAEQDAARRAIPSEPPQTKPARTIGKTAGSLAQSAISSIGADLDDEIPF